jgi:Transposase IS66 family
LKQLQRAQFGQRSERLDRNQMRRALEDIETSLAGWHNPLYRQAQIMKLQGLLDDRSTTLAFWVGVAAAELKPIYLRMKQLLLGSAKIAVDETRAPVLDPGRGRTKTGYFWAISRDDRPWGRVRSSTPCILSAGDSTRNKATMHVPQ